MLITTQDDGSVWSLEKNDDLAWAYMPTYLARVSEFSRKYDGDADVKTLQEAIERTFTSPQPGGLFLAYINGYERMAGHLLVTLETWFGTKMATIVQYELDEPLGREATQHSLAFIEDWAKKNGSEFLQVLAVNEKVARIYSIYDGFTRNKIMMRKSLRPPTGVANDGPLADNAT